MNFLQISLLLVIVALIPQNFGWPDGAPCIHAAYESMNPLEAVEHQGGLQLTEPPYTIELDRKCYWLNQPIGVQLKGNDTKTRFKGFQIQPIVWKGTKFGQRVGEFVRLDDNGSWQFQCFRKKDSITHSHDENKKQMKMWWKNNDDDTQYVQFVATVVVNLKKFWVKSVVSAPLPPCKVEREVGPWAKPPPREPPPVNQFKMDTWRIFNHESAGTFPRSIASFNEEDGSFKPSPRRTEKPFVPVFVTTRPTPAPVFATMPPQTRPPPPTRAPTFPPPTTTTTRQVFQVQPQRPAMPAIQRPQPQFQRPQPPQPQPQTRQRLFHIIPLANMEMNRRTPNPIRSQPVQTPTLVTIAPTRNIGPQQSQFQRLMNINRQLQQRQQQQQQQQRPNQLCSDRDSPGRCFGWISYCGQSAYMELNCRRTCRLC